MTPPREVPENRRPGAPPANKVTELDTTDDSETFSQGFEQFAFPTRYVITTNSGWVNLRGQPMSFSVGLGRNGWGIDVGRQYTDSRQGYVTGSTVTSGPNTGNNSVNKCLWILNTQANVPANNPPRDDCVTAPSLRHSSYMVLFNGNRQGVNCTPDWQCDGTSVQINPNHCPSGAPVMGNVQPWRPGLNSWGDGLYWIPPGAIVKWRYITPDWQWVMMRNPASVAHGGPAQDWAFVPGVCFQDNITYAEAPPA